MPAHFLGISLADLGAPLLVHSRAIGNSALIVVDRATNRAERVDRVVEQIAKPTLLAIPGIQRVTHRARARDHEVEAARLRVPGPGSLGTAAVL